MSETSVLPGIRSVDLSGVRAKIDRGKAHTEAARKLIARWFEEHPQQFEGKFDDECYLSYTLRARIPADPPLCELALLSGDAVHNMRCALDHLVFALAVAEGGTLTPTALRRLTFPITDNEKSFADARRQLSFLTAETISVIESFQPYKRPSALIRPLLTILRDLDNADKHRTLPVAWGATHSVELNYQWLFNPSLNEPEMETNMGPLKDGDTVARFKFNFPNPSFSMEGHLNLMVAVWHTHDRSADPRDCRTDFFELLNRLAKEIDTVVDGVLSRVGRHVAT